MYDVDIVDTVVRGVGIVIVNGDAMAGYGVVVGAECVVVCCDMWIGCVLCRCYCWLCCCWCGRC